MRSLICLNIQIELDWTKYIFLSPVHVFHVSYWGFLFLSLLFTSNTLDDLILPSADKCDQTITELFYLRLEEKRPNRSCKTERSSFNTHNASGLWHHNRCLALCVTITIQVRQGRALCVSAHETRRFLDEVTSCEIVLQFVISLVLYKIQLDVLIGFLYIIYIFNYWRL